MEQIIILITGVVSIWLVNDDQRKYRKYACIVGLIGQPFWFYSAWVAEMWGVLFLAVFYTVAWARGFCFYWVKK